MTKQSFFFVEITDTFGGEVNYSWVTRYKVKASSFRGAISKVSRDSGLSFRKVTDYCDETRYDSKSSCICAFVSEWDDEHHEQCKVNNNLA